MARIIKGYMRSDGIKVKKHTRKNTKNSKKYTPAQKRALERSRTSKSGHKTVSERMKTKRPGRWAQMWNQRRKKGEWNPKRK